MELETESKIDVIGWYFLLQHSELDEEFVFLEDISLFLPFPHLDQQLFELETLHSSEPIVDYADFMHNLGSQGSSGKYNEYLP